MAAVAAFIPLAISMIEEAVKIEPAIQQELTSIFSNPNPSPADYEALRQKYTSKTYADYVPDSDLTPPLPGMASDLNQTPAGNSVPAANASSSVASDATGSSTIVPPGVDVTTLPVTPTASAAVAGTQPPVSDPAPPVVTGPVTATPAASQAPVAAKPQGKFIATTVNAEGWHVKAS